MVYNNPNQLTADETTHLLTQLIRMGSAIDKELTLISERMSWFMISESFIFSAFTMAVAHHERTIILVMLAWIMPLVGSLLGLCVYPALLAANRTSNRLKAERHQFELKLPEDLRVTLLASPRERIWGSVPAFVIPVMLVLVWSIIFATVVFVPWRAQ